MQTQPIPVFHELVAINRRVMKKHFKRLKWEMIASFECEVSRIDGEIKLRQTSFWVTPDRNPRGMMTMQFDSHDAAVLGAKMKNDSITAATGEQGDCEFVIGFANDEYMAKDIVEEYVDRGTHTAVAFVAYEPTVNVPVSVPPQ